MLSNYNNRTSSKAPDWFSVMLYGVLVFMGVISIYCASSSPTEAADIFSFDSRAGKQLVWIGMASLLAIGILTVDAKFFFGMSNLFYFFMIAMLVLTIFVAPDIKGSRSWLVLGPVSIQPAEFSKFATALVLARYMSEYDFDILKLKKFFFVAGIILLPMLCIIGQKETGSALVYSIFILMLYREGLPGIFLFLFFWAIFLFIIILRFSSTVYDGGDLLGNLLAYSFILTFEVFSFYRNNKRSNYWKVLLLTTVALLFVSFVLNKLGWLHIRYEYVMIFGILMGVAMLIVDAVKAFKGRQFHLIVGSIVLGSLLYAFSVNFIFNNILQPHQQMRIKVAFGMEEDPYGAGYNVNQAKIAIGSGGFWGKGFLQGTQTKLKYVPEQDTDFIFCTICEEFGFVGSSIVVLLFLCLIGRILYLAERQNNVFARVYGYCVAGIIFFHLAINVGMVIGIMPVIGIPLPLFSYGGSSLWSFTILLFIFLNLEKNGR